VYFEQHIIGIIGLTGGKEVKKYAEILKKMTEIQKRGISERFYFSIKGETSSDDRIAIVSFQSF
jgi:hypothetical protein